MFIAVISSFIIGFFMGLPIPFSFKTSEDFCFGEFILASDPLVANSHNAVQGRVIEAGGEDHFAITFRRWVGAEELETSIQSSFDGNVWTTAKVVRDSISLNGDGTQTEVWRSTDPIIAKRVELLRVLGSIPQ